MDLGNAEHERRMGEKDKEIQELKEKYSELEKHFNKTREGLPLHVKKEAFNLVGKIFREKDLEIQKLEEQINHLLSQQGSQTTEMEEEIPKIKPERIEIEENKEEVTPTQCMPTRSQGPPSFGEKIQQEVYDPLGNLTWKGSVYTIPNMGDCGVYDVVVNLIHKATGNNKNFKNNFVNYAQEVEGDKRAFDNNGYIKRR